MINRIDNYILTSPKMQLTNCMLFLFVITWKTKQVLHAGERAPRVEHKTMSAKEQNDELQQQIRLQVQLMEEKTLRAEERATLAEERATLAEESYISRRESYKG